MSCVVMGSDRHRYPATCETDVVGGLQRREHIRHSTCLVTQTRRETVRRCRVGHGVTRPAIARPRSRQPSAVDALTDNSFTAS